MMPAPGNMANLLGAQTAISNLAENSPHLLADVEVTRALKHSLMAATIACPQVMPTRPTINGRSRPMTR